LSLSDAARPLVSAAIACALIPRALLSVQSAHAQEENKRRAAISSALEREVVLPEGASSIGSYSRNYAMASDRVVIAVFIEVPPIPEKMGCHVVLSVRPFQERPCTEQEVATGAEKQKAYQLRIAPVGQARWFESVDELPSQVDGGCSYITIVYDLKLERFESVECNGLA